MERPTAMSVTTSHEVSRSTQFRLGCHMTACDWPGTVSAAPQRRLFKSVLDRVLAFLLLIPGLPLIVLLAALIRITSRGPAFCSQLRVGKGGRIFTIYKLRSFRVDA